jgi:hypothetical protein
MRQPNEIAKDVLIEFHDSLTIVDFMVVDMDPHQQIYIILGKPFLKSVRATIDKMRGIINMKVDGVHEKFIYHPKNLMCCCQIRVHRFMGLRRVRCERSCQSTTEVALNHETEDHKMLQHPIRSPTQPRIFL